VAAVGADQFALAGQRAFLELAEPDVAVGVFIAALAVQLVVLEAADIDVAIGAVEGAVAFQLAVDEVAAELLPLASPRWPSPLGLPWANWPW
jgi:hypothetical protein